MNSMPARQIVRFIAVNDGTEIVGAILASARDAPHWRR
jgi:hypothetical protein